MTRTLLIVPLLLMAGAVAANDAPKGAAAARTTLAKADGAKAGGGAKTISGMSILGNQEAPKSLVIVPWKSSEIGDSLGIDTLLDASRQPVDKDVFMRELAYYQVRSESK